jgi:hypothetical protein
MANIPSGRFLVVKQFKHINIYRPYPKALPLRCTPFSQDGINFQPLSFPIDRDWDLFVLVFRTAFDSIFHIHNQYQTAILLQDYKTHNMKDPRTANP